MERKLEQPHNNKMLFAYDTGTVHRILKNGTREEISEMLIKSKVDLSSIDDNGDSVLHAILRNEVLIEADLIEISANFLSQGVSPNIKNKDEQTVLHLAVKRRIEKAVTLLLEYEAKVYLENERGDSIAHFFIEDEYEKCKLAVCDPMRNTVKNREKMITDSVSFLLFLMGTKVDFDRKNELGQSALHLAIVYYLPHFLATLLKCTKDIKLIDKDGKTLSQLFLGARLSKEHCHFAYHPRYTAKCVRILLDRGAPLSVLNKTCDVKTIRTDGNWNIIEMVMRYYVSNRDDEYFATTFLDELIGPLIWTNEAKYFFELLHDLVSFGINSAGTQVEKLVRAAIEAKHLDLLALLRENGADFNLRLNRGCTPMYLLATETRGEGRNEGFYSAFCDLLVRGGCDVNATNERSESQALHAAAGFALVPMIRVLIGLGAQVDCRDKEMKTPLHLAVEWGRCIESIEFLLTSGADVNAKNHEGQTPLHLAASNRDVEIARMLIERGASVDCEDKFRQTPLHRATFEDAATLVELFLASQADVNAKDYQGRSPLHHAVYYDRASMVELLLRHGADVNAKDDKGNRPLHCASRRSAQKSERILKLLLKNGAYVNARNNRDESVLFTALSSVGNRITFEQLLKYNANLNDPKVRNLMRTVRNKSFRGHLFFQRHWEKMAAAGMSLDEQCRAFVNENGDRKYYSACLKEIEILKSIFIDDFESVYDFLHMSLERKCVCMNREKLKQLIESPSFEKQFPVYAAIIQASYYVAKVFQARKKVLDFMAEIFFDVYNVSVHDIAEKIVNYLQDDDLRVSVPF